MPVNARRFAVVVSAAVVLSCLFTFTEAKLRLPYTTPAIQTNHTSVTDPETGEKVAVFPVSFTVTVADCFSQPVALVDGSWLKGPAIIQTHVFIGASMKLVFDVPNPGLDFLMNLTSAEYPVIQDQYGSLWKPVSPLKLEVVKEDTKYTYDVGNVRTASYQSQSESVVTPVGTPQYDMECYRTKACCGLNNTNYRKYSLVDSPVPPYACTSEALTYQPSTFLFKVHGVLKSRKITATSDCALTANQKKGQSVVCNRGAIAVDGLSVSPLYSIPSTGYMLCRQGAGLTDPSYEASPIPVVNTAFCSTKTCIGYTADNYMKDRVGCYEYSLGFYTSLDGNNTNQFSYYESSASGFWSLIFKDLKWIDDAGMSSSTPSTINNISFQRDVPASTGWSLTYADFPLPLTDTLQPLFPIGRPTRVTARINDATNPTAVVVTVEYVSFSNFTGANWTIQTCVGTLCGSSLYPAAADANRYPTLMTATVRLTSLGLTPQLLPSEVVVTVTCATTPTANPFHTLLKPSTVTVGAAILPSATSTVNVSLAREPLQDVPSPYAASLGANDTSRIICQGDYRFSTATRACVPLTDQECAIKYRGRRISFNTTMNACMCQAPVLTSPLVYRPLPDPLPPPTFTEEDIRALMKSLKVPKFMQTMEQAIDDHDAKLASQGQQRPTQKAQSPTTAAATSKAGNGKLQQEGAPRSATASASSTTTSDTKSSLPAEIPGFFELSVACIAATGVTWIFILFRDVFYKCGGVKEWSAKNREVTQRPVPPPTPSAVSPAAQTPPMQSLTVPVPLPVHPPSSVSTPMAPPPQPQRPKPDKDDKPRAKDSAVKSKVQVKEAATARCAALPASTPASSCAADPHNILPPFTSPTSHLRKQAPASHTLHRCSGRKEHAKPHRRSSSHRGQSPPQTRRQTAPTWEDVSPVACAPSPLNCAAERHTPFGYTSRGYAPDDTSPRDEYTSRSGGADGSGGAFHDYFAAFEYVPAPPAYAEDPEGQRWYSFPATPPRSPPTESCGWGSRRFDEEYFAKSPPYARVSSIHDPFGSSRSAAAHSMRSGQQSPSGSEQYPARSPVRQSSRVEVLPSDADEDKGNHQASAEETKSHHVESID